MFTFLHFRSLDGAEHHLDETEEGVGQPQSGEERVKKLEECWQVGGKRQKLLQ